MDQDWKIPYKSLRGCRLYQISRHSVLHESSRENAEYIQHAGQLANLCKTSLSEIKRVDRIVYDSDAIPAIAFRNRKMELEQCGLGTAKQVFHGTPTEQNLLSIAINGFIVGGSDPSVPIANGAAYGTGVYTAKGPNTPMRYGCGTGKVVLAMALPGRNNYHSVAKNEDWIIFKYADLLLPLAIISFGPAEAELMQALPRPRHGSSFFSSLSRRMLGPLILNPLLAPIQAAPLTLPVAQPAPAFDEDEQQQQQQLLKRQLSEDELVASAIANSIKQAEDRQYEEEQLKMAIELSARDAGGADSALCRLSQTSREDDPLPRFRDTTDDDLTEMCIIESLRTFAEEQNKKLFLQVSDHRNTGEICVLFQHSSAADTSTVAPPAAPTANATTFSASASGSGSGSASGSASGAVSAAAFECSDFTAVSADRTFRVMYHTRRTPTPSRSTISALGKRDTPVTDSDDDAEPEAHPSIKPW